jgi:hypothetical protein
MQDLTPKHLTDPQALDPQALRRFQTQADLHLVTLYAIFHA